MLELTNTTYENGLISILLNSDIDTIIEVASVLTVEDFSSQNILAAGLYAIIKKLINDDREINPVNIVAEAEKISKILNALGGKEKAFETIEILKDVYIDIRDWKVYVEEIKKYSLARKILKENKNLEQKILNEIDTMTLDEVINEPQKLLVDIITEKKDEGIHISEGIESYLEASEEEVGTYPGFLSRWNSLTKTILSHQKKMLEVYYAPTHEGKSFLLLNEADYLGNELFIPTLYIDTEMLEEQQQPRLLSIRTGIPYVDIKLKTFLREMGAREKIKKAIEEIKNGKLYWVSLADFDHETIERIVRYHIVKYGIEVLIFDYIKIPEVKGGLNETQQIGNLCNFLKNSIAKKMDLCVIAATQADENDRTRVADSQRVKRFADILACWRKKTFDERKKEGFQNGNYFLDFTDGKNRENPLKPKLNFDFNGKSSEIIEMDNSAIWGTTKDYEQQTMFKEEEKPQKKKSKLDF